ncbi:hypothetical protein BH20ACT2_BH20ACT2_12210 [soil metagenome]
MSERSDLDGRTVRAQRTRAAIVDACLELVDELDLRPTAPRIAARAGVSVRSVFQHFDDLEGLFSAVAEQVVLRVAALVVPIDPGAELATRVEAIVQQRSLLLEALTPVRRAADVHAPFSAEITRRLQDGHDFLRAEVAAVFATELAGLTGDAADDVLDALDAALSWSTWHDLRRLNRRSPDRARRVVARLVAGILRSAGARI